MAAEAIEITKSPTIVQMASPRFMWTNLNLLRHSLSCFVGSSRHAITLPKIRIGSRTTTVPLRYQPIIGAIPNPSRSHGITATIVSHNKREKTPNTMAVVRSPIGAGVVCFSADMAMIRFCCNDSKDLGISSFPYHTYGQRRTGSCARETVLLVEEQPLRCTCDPQKFYPHGSGRRSLQLRQ